MISTFATERVGVSAAQLEFSKWGWAFREQPIVDFGIDAHVEPFAGDVASGRLIALQIKSGVSWFSEPAAGGWVYRGRDTHLLYWLRHCLPVVILLHDPESDLTYWAHVRQSAAEITDGGWKMLVPSSQVLSKEAVSEFRSIAESASGASDDPLESSCQQLPPSTAMALRAAQGLEPAGTLRLATLLAAGRVAPDLTVGSVLSAAPSWLPKGNGQFEVAMATYAAEHGFPDLAAEAFAGAADYDGQPGDVLRAYAALAAAEAGDSSKARLLIGQIQSDPESSLVLAAAVAVVGHLGEQGPIPVPAVLATATRAQLAAEPTCLAFLGAQALQRRDAMAAVRYFEEGSAANPDGSALMLHLARALQLRVSTAQSALPTEDLRRIEALARQALDQRRRWSGPSGEALGMLMRRQAQVGAFEETVRLGTPAPEGEASECEASFDEVVVLGVQVSLALLDHDRARQFASRAESDHARAVVRALLADQGLPASEEIALWRAVMTDGAPLESKMMALYHLAGLGVWPLRELDDLREAHDIEGLDHDLLAARAMAASGDLQSALSLLRTRAETSPMAAEMIVDLLQDAGRFDDALEEAGRGFERFGEAVLAHKRLNLLVLADRPSDAAEEAIRLLARPDTAPELRLRTRRQLMGHYAHAGNWPAVEDQARAALTESPDAADLQWNLIAATGNQGRLGRAHELFRQFRPEITNFGQAGLWMSLHIQNGFSPDDVSTALDLLDRWPEEESFEAQVLSAFLGAAGRRAPDGTPILPDLDPPALHRFQSRLNSYAARHPDGPIRVMNFDPQGIVDMLRAQLAPQAEAIDEVERLVREGRNSLGALAALLGQSYAKALIQRSPGVIVAVTTDPGAYELELRAARAALDNAVILQASGIAVATILPGRWPQLRGSFTELRIPRDAWEDFQAARYDLTRDPESTYSVGYDLERQVLVSHQMTNAEHEFLTRRVGEIDRALQDARVVATPELGTFAGYSPAATDPSMSPLALAQDADTPLWCDDVVLRVIANQHGIPAFGTVALLEVLIETGRLPDTLRDDILELARGYVTDLTLTPEELLSLAAETGYQAGAATTILTRPVFWADPSAAQEVALDLIAAAHARAPQVTPIWFRAACHGLAARQPEVAASSIPSLAKAVSGHIDADTDLDAVLTEMAMAALDDVRKRQSGVDESSADNVSDQLNHPKSVDCL